MATHLARLPRSYLFVPADRPERVGKALAAGADAVIVDLEDAVAPGGKAAAREALRQPWSSFTQQAAQIGVPLLVRVNATGTPYHDDDIAWCHALGIIAVVLPKADAGSVQALRRSLPDAECHALLETAAGFAQLPTLAAQPGVVRLMFGSIDLMGDLGIADEGEPLHAFRSLLVLHSRAAGLPAPVDGVCTALGDTAALAAETARARAFGFGAKLLVHPAQVGPVHAGLAPTEAELAWARRVVEAAAAADGAAIAVDGKMVDRPVLERARRILTAG